MAHKPSCDSVPSGAYVMMAQVPAQGSHTWLEVKATIRSRSSTSCLKVGLWEGTACQQSRIIMYLRQDGEVKQGGQQRVGPSRLVVQRGYFLQTEFLTLYPPCPCFLPSLAQDHRNLP